MSEALRTYEKGQVIFAQGAPGGDLFFIKEGEIEIFNNFEGHDIVLSTMKAGEVLGTLTLLTKDPRIAGARAATKVVVQHVPQATVVKTVQDIPKWMLIVLKDFTARLKTMNERYVKTSKALIEALANPINTLYTAAQFACTLAETADSKKIKLNDTLDVVPKSIADYVAPMLFGDLEEFSKIFEIFVRSGMITIEVDKATDLSYFTLKNAINLKNFGEFFKELSRKKVVGVLTTRFLEKEIAMVEALVKYAEAKGQDVTRTVKFKVAELAVDFEDTVKIPYIADAIVSAEVLKMLRLEGGGEEKTLSFDAKTLKTGIAHVKAYNLLVDLENKKTEGGAPSGTAS